MIYYVAQADNDWPPQSFLRTWGRDLARSFATIHTHQFGELAELPLGTYLFTDLERQTLVQKKLQAAIWNRLAAAGEGVRLLNHPMRAMGRFELLLTLSDRGSNSFRAFRFTDVPADLQFPVFLRGERDHEGARSPLLASPNELDEALVRQFAAGCRPEDLLIVEFCETVDEGGIYRKFSAFRVSDRIVPRHLIFGRGWMLKYPVLIDESRLAEERAYLEANPHETELREIFDLAGIDYGRIDYALADGRIQVWEINTNPIVTLPPSEYDPRHIPHQEWFAAAIVEAFRSIDSPRSASRIPIRIGLADLEPISAPAG